MTLIVNDPAKSADWLSSEETRKELRISNCDLMHLREAGNLRFKKQGNAFFYAQEDVKRSQTKGRKH